MTNPPRNGIVRQTMKFRATILTFCTALLTATTAPAATRYVAVSGFTDTNANQATNPATPWSLARACTRALAGDLVLVSPGVYSGAFQITATGTPAAPITFRANGAPGTVVIDGGTATGSNGLLLVRAGGNQVAGNLVIEGFELRNLTTSDGSGVRLVTNANGLLTNVTVRNCHIHSILGTNAMGITVYALGDNNPLSGILIEGCDIHDCQPAPSEAMTFNGNVSNFIVRNCTVHDCNNIGIDMIGGEEGFPTGLVPGDLRVTRNGLVTGNRVWNIHQTEGITAAGIYVDGGRDIIIEHNRVETSDAGIEIAAENAGFVAQGVIVRNNILTANTGNGLILGSADAEFGRAEGNTIANNLFYHNGTGDPFESEIFIQYGSGNIIENNLVIPSEDQLASFFFVNGGNSTQIFRNNLWYAPTGGQGDFALYPDDGCCGSYGSFVAMSSALGTPQDSGGKFTNPQFVNAAAGDFHLLPSSPARDAGFSDPLLTGPQAVDMDGFPRKQGIEIDIGPDEAWPVDAWIRSNFPAHTISQALLSLDADDDGFTNLMEYATGFNPNLKSARPGIAISLNGSGAQRMPWISAQRRTLSIDAPLLLFQSADMAKWIPVQTPSPTVLSTSGVSQNIQWRLTTPISGKGFFRTSATLTP